MIKVLILFIVLIAGIIIGPIVAGHQGYVLIQTNNYDIETSVTGLVICFIILQFIFCLLGLCYRRIRGTSSFTHNWLKGCKYHKTHSQTQKALLKLAEGDFSQVEKLLTGHADYAEQPVVNYLLAAEAAHQRGVMSIVPINILSAQQKSLVTINFLLILHACVYNLLKVKFMQHVTVLINYWIRHRGTLKS